MNLHRSGNKPQWEDVPPEQRTLVQKVAAKTKGNVTPGNVVSAAGGVLVLAGLYDISKGKNKSGIAKIAVGRICDLLDGSVAEATKTKSPKGEAVDAGVDKALIAAAVPSLVKAGVLPVHVAAPIAAQNVASAKIALDGKKQGVEIHPSVEGKQAVAAQWGAIGLYALAAVADKTGHHRVADGLEAAGLAALSSATVLGTAAVIGYHKDLHS